MEILDEKTVVVFTSAELKEVLEGNNGYTFIYFGADITLLSGITLSNTKTNITLDGTYQNITKLAGNISKYNASIYGSKKYQCSSSYSSISTKSTYNHTKPSYYRL
mgnify:CR=1 FL=1